MPDDTVYITDVEIDICEVFTKRGIMDNATILATLRQLMEKMQK